MDGPADPVFPQPLVEAFLRDPETPAFEFRSQPVTRAEVLGLIRSCVAGLRAAGLGAGRGVAVTTAVTPAGFAAQIAAHLLGCRVTGLRPGLTPPQLRHVLAQDVEAVVADGTTATADLAAAAEAAAVPVVDLDLVLLAAGGHAEREAGHDGDDGLVARGRPDDIALVCLTSGSTGNPKGSAQTYRALSRHWSWQPAGWSDRARRLAGGYGRFLVFGTLTSAVMLEHLALCLLSGGTAVIPDEPVSFPSSWERHRVTACLCTVARLYQVLDTLRTEQADTSSLRALLVAGSPLPPHRLAEAVERLGPVVYQGYGQTETGMLSLLGPEDLAEHGDQVLDTVGRPMPGVAISARDPHGQPVPAGTTGEIWVRAAGAMSGYWHDEDETREVVREGWIRTRDLGTLGADGYLRLLGRARDVIFVNAILHYAGAIEAALAAHPDVDQAYVVGAPDEHTGEAAHAFVVPTAGRTPAPDDLRAAVRAVLGEGAEPATVTLLDSVPVAPSGKPDKKALLARVPAGG
ncbi:class I adenylate-forming enzyme family protein [Actinacidiphila paucisporea]|uniref:Long-chain-fatty-acid--CoA ligase n=1 Tax=Actinacidiphila paucisporea TaxID=310782 RepID=A0A1M7NPB4_9ACTN|nr:fatty acid--CoA ligase family protein [Actinacidiphila paucisporea]SHN05838.1 Acyl-CoA synthetase (AMP-forming)/AMP-acid ligase II [Actinacidiphila paucisporea]